MFDLQILENLDLALADNDAIPAFEMASDHDAFAAWYKDEAAEARRIHARKEQGSSANMPSVVRTSIPQKNDLSQTRVVHM